MLNFVFIVQNISFEGSAYFHFLKYTRETKSVEAVESIENLIKTGKGIDLDKRQTDLIELESELRKLSTQDFIKRLQDMTDPNDYNERMRFLEEGKGD